MSEPARITLTDSQLKQLRDFLEEKNHSGSIALRESPNLPEGWRIAEVGVPVVREAVSVLESDGLPRRAGTPLHHLWPIACDPFPAGCRKLVCVTVARM